MPAEIKTAREIISEHEKSTNTANKDLRATSKSSSLGLSQRNVKLDSTVIAYQTTPISLESNNNENEQTNAVTQSNNLASKADSNKNVSILSLPAAGSQGVKSITSTNDSAVVNQSNTRSNISKDTKDTRSNISKDTRSNISKDTSPRSSNIIKDDQQRTTKRPQSKIAKRKR